MVSKCPTVLSLCVYLSLKNFSLLGPPKSGIKPGARVKKHTDENTDKRLHALADAKIEQFSEQGYLSPLDVFTASEVAQLRQKFEDFEQHHGDAAVSMRTDLHLLASWAWRAVTDPRLIDPLVSLLGQNVLLWSMNWFLKEPGDGKFVSLHQDANYWGLEPHDVITAWVALSDAGLDTGPMHFVPGSHHGALYEHDNTYSPDNLLTRGQTIQANLDNVEQVAAPLAAGQMSLHHIRLIHGSQPNESKHRRIGMVLRFCATHVRQTKGQDTAVLVAGQDDFGHFELLQAPRNDYGEQESSQHIDSVKKLGQIIMSD